MAIIWVVHASDVDSVKKVVENRQYYQSVIRMKKSTNHVVALSKYQNEYTIFDNNNWK